MATRGEIRGKSIARRGKQIRDWRHSQESAYKPFGESSFHPRFERETIDVDVPTQKEIPDRKRGDRKPGIIDNASTMVEDLIINPAQKYLPGMAGGIQRGLASLTNNWEQNDENEEILGNAYSDEVRKAMMSPSDREFYERYIKIGDSKSGQEADYYYDEARKALENAQITKRVNYALGEEPFGYDTVATEGVAAFGADKPVVDYGTLSGRLQSGLQGTKGGRDFIKEHAIPKEGDTPAITRAIENFYGGQSRLALDEELNTRIPPTSPINVQIKPKPPYKPEGWDEQFLFSDEGVKDITPPGFGEQLDYDELSGQFFPREAHQQSGVFGRGEAPMSEAESQLLMDLYKDPEHGDPYYRNFQIPPGEEGGPGYNPYTGVNPFTEPYVPVEGPPMPPPLSGDTDWWTPEPEAKGLIPKGLEELIIDQYGVDAPGVEREREWPNTPPPGYERPPWYNRAWDWMKEGPWPTY